MVDSLEDLDVELPSSWRVEGHSESHEGICETLDTKTDRSVSHVTVSCLDNRVVVSGNDLDISLCTKRRRLTYSVQVLGNDLGNLVELLEVVDSLLHVDKCGKSEGSQVTDGNLVGSRVLDDFGTQVGRLDGSQVLLVRLGIGSVLVEHVWGTGLGLGLEDGEPELLCLDGLFTLASLFVAFVQLFEFGRVDIGKSGAFSRTHECPVAIRLHSLHE